MHWCTFVHVKLSIHFFLYVFVLVLAHLTLKIVFVGITASLLARPLPIVLKLNKCLKNHIHWKWCNSISGTKSTENLRIVIIRCAKNRFSKFNSNSYYTLAHMGFQFYFSFHSAWFSGSLPFFCRKFLLMQHFVWTIERSKWSLVCIAKSLHDFYLFFWSFEADSLYEGVHSNIHPADVQTHKRKCLKRTDRSACGHHKKKKQSKSQETGNWRCLVSFNMSSLWICVNVHGFFPLMCWLLVLRKVCLFWFCHCKFDQNGFQYFVVFASTHYIRTSLYVTLFITNIYTFWSICLPKSAYGEVRYCAYYGMLC